MESTPARRHYEVGVPAEIEVPTDTIGDLLPKTIARYGKNIAIDFLGKRYTYADLGEEVERAAGLLRTLGVRKGDVVALILPNCPQHITIFHAVMRLGGIVAEHNPLAPPAELREQISAHGGRLIIAWENTLNDLLADGPIGDHTVLSVNLTAALPWRSQFLLKLPIAAARKQRKQLRARVPNGVQSWEKLLAGTRPIPPEFDPEITAEDIAILLHTGGTTGTPKAVALSHRNILANSEQSHQWMRSLEDGKETVLAVLPFFHAYGMTLSMGLSLVLGATQLVLPKFDVDMVLAAQKRRPITIFMGVPPMIDRLADAAMEKGVDLTSIKCSMVGAMSLTKEIADKWEKVTDAYVIEGYGMTEAGPCLMGNPVSEGRRPGSLGIPFPSTEIKIVDPEDPSKEVAPGEVGELIARGPQVFPGYFRNKEETEHALIDGEWLRTGDLCREEDGFYYLADRRKELIINGGFNIYPSQVEEAVRSHPGVVDVAVVGLNDDSRGEQVVAALVLEPGVTVDLDSIRDWAAKRVPHYALPRKIAILDELPRSQIGKVMRRTVRENIERLRSSADETIIRLRTSKDEAVEKLKETSDEVSDKASEFIRDLKENIGTATEKAARRTGLARHTAHGSSEESAGADKGEEAMPDDAAGDGEEIR